MVMILFLYFRFLRVSNLVAETRWVINAIVGRCGFILDFLSRIEDAYAYDKLLVFIY